MSNVGVEELSNNNFKVFPNPSTGVFIIEGLNNEMINAIMIRDIQGKEVATHAVDNSTFSIDLSMYNAGVYYLIVETNEGQKLNYRLVKQ